MFDQLYDVDTTAGAVSITPVAAPVTSIKGAVLAQFKATEPVLRTLVARYADVAIDCSTPKGLASAKEARHDMRENGRFVVQRAEKAIKDEVNGLKSIIADEAERLIAIVQPTEKLYDDAIKARETELAAEKAEREAKEAARVAAHRANISKIAGYVNQAQGRTSEQLVAMINGVAAIEIDPAAWEEFAVGAEMQKSETLEALQALFDRTKKAEDEAAAQEAQRIENERRAAELAEQQRIIAEKQAELDRQLAEVAATKAEAAERKQDAQSAAKMGLTLEQFDAAVDGLAKQLEKVLPLPEEAAVDLSQGHPDQLNDDALAARPEIADAIAAVPPPSEALADMQVVTALAWSLPVTTSTSVTFVDKEPPSGEPTLTLGAMNDRFGGVLALSARGLAALGFEPLATKKAAVLFSEAQFLAICDALVERIGEVVAACEA